MLLRQSKSMHVEHKDNLTALRPLLLVEKESARSRRARYSDPLILHKWTQFYTAAEVGGMGDIGLSEHEDLRPPVTPFSTPTPRLQVGDVFIQQEPRQMDQQPDPITPIKQNVPVANLPATDFAK